MKYTTVKKCAMAVALAACAGCGEADAGDGKNTAANASSAVVTNDNGGITRTFVESSVTTNGNLVTEHRRETRTETDMGGNVLQTTTSEYAQSYNVGDAGRAFPAPASPDRRAKDAGAAEADSFLGLKFGEKVDVTNCVQDASEPDLLRAAFKPKKPLAGFDDYYVYVTPKTHKAVKICACAKEAVEPAARWRRHYLVEALEKRYGTWARLCSIWNPWYAFDIAPGRCIVLRLLGASADYETAVYAWDEEAAHIGAEESAQLREEARKNAAEQRGRKVSDAADAF